MARSPKAPARSPDAEPEIRALNPPLLDASAARALAKAQERLGYDAPPIVAASIEADQAQSAPPAQSAAGEE